MIKFLSILFLCLHFSKYCCCQPDDLKRKTANSGTIPNTSVTVNKVDTVDKKNVIAPAPLLEVLFATNEDCDLYIGEEWKGQVLKSEFLYLKLQAGNYSYKAKSKATLDELKDSFIVKQGDLNEVFMDLLYLVDEKNRQRESVKNNVTATGNPLVITKKKAADPKPEIKKIESNKESEMSVINFLVANMVPIKGGAFVMGNNKAPSPDEVEHPVTVNNILFSKYEVTQHQWESIMGNNPSLNKGCPTCPVENVSWEEVLKFIRKINSIGDKKFRLPTEAEWEYVARIGGKTEIEKAGGQEEYIKKTAWYFANSGNKTHPVGRKDSNVAGIYDLTGNVSEWCSDWYGVYWYKEEYNHKNPEGPPLGKEKIIRGGNFKEYVGDRFRPSLRLKKNPVEKSGEVGFRLVMEPN
ncbi:MAG: formylglycine-generating enzyme family protein [Bacteroidota bacterium]|nr:formylglycine-generating enzyme family protein [Bacteroidota bacterium]